MFMSSFVCSGQTVSGKLIVTLPVAKQVWSANPRTGATELLSGGGLLTDPTDVEVAPNGTMFVSQEADDTVVKIKPGGAQSVVAHDDKLSPASDGLVRAPNGILAVATWMKEIVAVDPATGAQSLIAQPSFIPADLDLLPNGNLLVAHYGSTKGVSEVTPSGEISDFSIDSAYNLPWGVAIAPPRCAGRNATIVGSTGPDKLKGSKFRDVIATLGGNDRVKGLGGKDIICGGSGADRIAGGRGADRLLGQGGPDLLVGGRGRDRLKGGPGHDAQLP